MIGDDIPLRGLLRAQAAARALDHPEDRFSALDGAVTTYIDRRRAVIRAQQDEVLDGTRRRDLLEEDRQEVAAGARQLRPREAARVRVFSLCNPELLLAPANIVSVYRHEQRAVNGGPLWPAWSWEATDAVNRRMLPFVQGLDPDDPLPDDPRLALPMTMAGFWLYRALLIDPKGEPRHSPPVVMAVYDEIAEAIAALERRLVNAFESEPDGRFRADFTYVTGLAETLLLHAVRLGSDVWDLILPCPLGADCLSGMPFYVTRPGEDNPHGGCHTAASRRRVRRLQIPPA